MCWAIRRPSGAAALEALRTLAPPSSSSVSSVYDDEMLDALYSDVPRTPSSSDRWKKALKASQKKVGKESLLSRTRSRTDFIGSRLRESKQALSAKMQVTLERLKSESDDGSRVTPLPAPCLRSRK